MLAAHPPHGAGRQLPVGHVIVYGRDDSSGTAELLRECRARGISFVSRPLEPVRPAPNRSEALAKLRAAQPSLLEAAASGAGLEVDIPLVDVEGQLLQAPSVDEVLDVLRARGFAEPTPETSADGAAAAAAGAAGRLVVYTRGPLEADAWSVALVRDLRRAGLGPDLELVDTLPPGARPRLESVWQQCRRAPWWRGGEVPLQWPVLDAYGTVVQRPRVEDVLLARRIAGLPAPAPPPPAARAPGGATGAAAAGGGEAGFAAGGSALGAVGVTVFGKAADGATQRLRGDLGAERLAYRYVDIDASAAGARELWAALDSSAADGSGAAAEAVAGAAAGAGAPLPTVLAYGALLVQPSVSAVWAARRAAGLPDKPAAEELFAAAELSSEPGVRPRGRLAPPGAPALLAPAAAVSAGLAASVEGAWAHLACAHDYERVLAASKALRAPFEDPLFRADRAALYEVSAKPPRGLSGAGVLWLRPREVAAVEAAGPPLQPGGAVRLVQGHLADGWLLSALGLLLHSTDHHAAHVGGGGGAAARARDSGGAPGARSAASGARAADADSGEEHPSVAVLRARVLHDASAGAACVHLWAEGGWRAITVDDRLPCHARTRRPLFGTAAVSGSARGGGGAARAAGSAAGPAPRAAILVGLLEKAAAKLHGSYAALHSGSLERGLRLLTGASLESARLHPRAAAAKPAAPPVKSASAVAADAAALVDAVSAALGRGALVAARAGVPADASAAAGGAAAAAGWDDDGGGGLWRARTYAVVGARPAQAAGPVALPPLLLLANPWAALAPERAGQGVRTGVWEGARAAADAAAAGNDAALPPLAGGVSDGALRALLGGEGGACADDGSWFWLSAEIAISRALGEIAISEPAPAPLDGVSAVELAVAGRWDGASAGGGPRAVTFATNPHYVLTARADAEIAISLCVADARLARARPSAAAAGAARSARGGGGGGAPSRVPAIGLVVAEAASAAELADGGRLTDLGRRRRLTDSAPFVRAPCLSLRLKLARGRSYAVVPCAAEPGHCAPFVLCVRPARAADGGAGGAALSWVGDERAPLTLSACPALRDSAEADALVARYRAHLHGAPTAAAGPPAPREAPFCAEADAVDWDQAARAPDARAPAEARHTVQVRVLRADGLPPRDGGGPEARAALRAGQPPPGGAGSLPCAFCFVKIDDVHRTQRGRTAVFPSSARPAWAEAFTFDGVSAHASVVVDVYDHDALGTHDFLGKAVVHLAHAPRDGTPLERAHALIEGSLTLGVTVWP